MKTTVTSASGTMFEFSFLLFGFLYQNLDERSEKAGHVVAYVNGCGVLTIDF